MFAVHWPHSIRPLKLWNADSTTRNAIEFTAQKLLFEFENQPIRCSLQKLWPSVWCVGRHLTLLERLFPITLAYNGRKLERRAWPKDDCPVANKRKSIQVHHISALRRSHVRKSTKTNILAEWSPFQQLIKIESFFSSFSLGWP